jgi:choline dehydrogenase-like flavoprotein
MFKSEAVLKDGKRQDAAHAYLHPRLQDGDHPNLHVLVGSQVTRVILDEGKRATAVEFRPNLELMDDPTAAKPATGAVRTRTMVVVTAGAFGSPAILERSGIGDREVLQHACVPIVAHLPGVGHGYQDHQTSLYTYKADMPPEDSWESIYNGTRQIPELLANNDKILSWNGVDAAAKIRPTATEVDSLEPRFRQAWDQDFKDIKCKPLISMILVTG